MWDGWEEEKPSSPSITAIRERECSRLMMVFISFHIITIMKSRSAPQLDRKTLPEENFHQNEIEVAS